MEPTSMSKNQIEETIKYQFPKLRGYLEGVLLFHPKMVFSHMPVLKS